MFETAFNTLTALLPIIWILLLIKISKKIKNPIIKISKLSKIFYKDSTSLFKSLHAAFPTIKQFPSFTSLELTKTNKTKSSKSTPPNNKANK
jgi:predicted KAP-like P-loop ATPase